MDFKNLKRVKKASVYGRKSLTLLPKKDKRLDWSELNSNKLKA